MRPRADLPGGQAQLFERHRRGVVRLATTLSKKRGCEPNEVIVLLAHANSRVGTALGDYIGVPATRNLIVIPGIAPELPRWIARLALVGPVHDCTNGGEGVAVIVIDEHGAMALVETETTAVTGDPANRAIIPSG